MHRRTFLSRLTSVFTFLTACLVSLPLIRFLFASSTDNARQGWYRLIGVDAPELSEEISRVRFMRVVRQGWQSQTMEEIVWVRKKKDGSFTVYNTQCTHLGCAVSWDSKDKKFKCPCHGGVFDADGNRVEGPPPAPLQKYETRVDNGTLRIGKLLKS